MCSLMMAVASNLASAFTQNKIPSAHRLQRQRLAAVADPVELANAVTAGLELAPQVHDAVAATVAPVLTTLYTASAGALLNEAHGHTQPFWGTPDAFLTAGKSIAPTVKGLQEMGISKQVPDFATQHVGLADKVQVALTKGWKVLDSNAIQSEDILPGFSPTRSILQAHNPNVPAETPETFATQVEWSANFLNVIDKLPAAALSYGLIEFFLLRPGVDLYQQDIDDEPRQVLVETVVVTAVRMGVFAMVAGVTVGIFG